MIGNKKIKMTEHPHPQHNPHNHHVSHAQTVPKNLQTNKHASIDLDAAQFGKKNKKQRMSLLTQVFLFFILFSVLVALYVGLQNYRITQSINTLKSDIHAKQTILTSLQEEGQILEKLKAQNTLTQLTESRIQWSRITAIILTSIEKKDEINIQNIQGSADMKFSISGKAKDYETIAKLIRTIKKHKNFKKPFVSTVNRNTKGEINFNISFEYQQ